MCRSIKSQLIDSLMDCYSLISLLVILHYTQLIISSMVRNCSVALMKRILHDVLNNSQLNCVLIFVNFYFKDPHFYPKLLAGTVRFCANEAKGNQPCPGLIVKFDFQLHLDLYVGLQFSLQD